MTRIGPDRGSFHLRPGRHTLEVQLLYGMEVGQQERTSRRVIAEVTDSGKLQLLDTKDPPSVPLE